MCSLPRPVHAVLHLKNGCQNVWPDDSAPPYADEGDFIREGNYAGTAGIQAMINLIDNRDEDGGFHWCDSAISLALFGVKCAFPLFSFLALEFYTILLLCNEKSNFVVVVAAAVCRSFTSGSRSGRVKTWS